MCFLCLIDEAYPDENTPRDGEIIPVIHSDRDHCLHLLKYHPQCRKKPWDRYLPHLGDPWYDPDGWYTRHIRREEREAKKLERIRLGEKEQADIAVMKNIQYSQVVFLRGK